MNTGYYLTLSISSLAKDLHPYTIYFLLSISIFHIYQSYFLPNHIVYKWTMLFISHHYLYIFNVLSLIQIIIVWKCMNTKTKNKIPVCPWHLSVRSLKIEREWIRFLWCGPQSSRHMVSSYMTHSPPVVIIDPVWCLFSSLISIWLLIKSFIP